MAERYPIYIVDDDRDVRCSLSFSLSTMGLESRPFISGVDFLQALEELKPGCILLDVRMPDLDGIGMLKELKQRRISWPVILITGHGEVSLAVTAMKLGAVDFLEKPFEEETVVNCIERAFPLLREETALQPLGDIINQIRSLSARELEVLQALLIGHSNKSIANVLELSTRTVEMHRANMMAKLGAASLAQTLHVAIRAGIEGKHPQRAANFPDLEAAR